MQGPLLEQGHPAWISEICQIHVFNVLVVYLLPQLWWRHVVVDLLVASVLLLLEQRSASTALVCTLVSH